MKLLVIGSNSFSGSHVVRLAVQQKIQTIGIGRGAEAKPAFLAYRELGNMCDLDSYFEYYNKDIVKDSDEIISLIAWRKPEVIINFAALGMVEPSWANPVAWYETNFLAHVRLVEGLKNFSFIHRYVHISTPEVYGDTGRIPIQECRNYNPTTPYALSKSSLDIHLLNLFREFGFPVVLTRASNVYGPCQGLYRIVPKAILYSLSGKEILLDGGGSSVRSFIFVEDAMRATLRLGFEAEPGSIWHISANDYTTISDLVRNIYDLTAGNQSLISTGIERRGKDGFYMIDNSKIKSRFSWSCRTSLTEGILATKEWISRHMDEFRQL